MSQILIDRTCSTSQLEMWLAHVMYNPSNICLNSNISMAYSKTALSPLLMHWRYWSFALSHRYDDVMACVLLPQSWPFVLMASTGYPYVRFTGPTLGPSGADMTKVAPCWPHELCYLGSDVEPFMFSLLLSWIRWKRSGCRDFISHDAHMM